MVRGPKKHLKRLAAPNHWMMNKMGGIFAPRPNAGPHILKECVPLIVLIRNRMKYALTAAEVQLIVRKRMIKVDGRVRTSGKYPIGLFDIMTIVKTGENFRCIYDNKGRLYAQPISEEEASWKLCKVARKQKITSSIPVLRTTCSRTITYPHPDIKSRDTIKISLPDGKIMEWWHFKTGQIAITTGGKNRGRIGIITLIEKHDGTDTVLQLKDARGREWNTVEKYVVVIGNGSNPVITLPKQQGIRLGPIEERQQLIRQNEGLLE